MRLRPLILARLLARFIGHSVLAGVTLPVLVRNAVDEDLLEMSDVSCMAKLTSASTSASASSSPDSSR